MLAGFQQTYNFTHYSQLQKDGDFDYPPIEKMIKSYQDPKNADKLLKLEDELSQTQQVLTKTMSDVGV